MRLTSNDGKVIYIDPYKGKGYNLPADIVLVTHKHSDHNKVNRYARKPKCCIITNEEALAGSKHNSFDINGILIQAVTAKNRKHDPKKCVGYIITMDGIKVYASGDTSMTKQMETFAAMEIDYALFPCDGLFNMGFEEAAECAALVGARNNIIIHPIPIENIRKKAEKWNAPNKLIVEPGQEIEL
jgi:L-ascorbate metabolism protein UlaG (beta-lactamase superfamily)